ncbi:MAG TPA: hypothetical protein VLD62_06385 [Acidimicrobiia bacterium]|nr:hypothetical protein [Acidimicrobiia bacterium]
MDASRYRLVYTGLGLSLAALVAVLVAFWPAGEEFALPDPLEGLFPLPGDIVVRQTAVEVDLPVGYSFELAVDGVRIPEDEIGVTEATGIRTWQPDAFSVIPGWSAGDHTVFVAWDTTFGRPAPGSFEWTFTVR